MKTEAETSPAGPPLRGQLRAALELLRLHQWAKNLLIFGAAVLSHRWAEPGVLSRALQTFLAFGCVASALYVANDYLDREADRRHPTKRDRPLASGRVPPGVAAGLFGVSLALGLGLALFLPRAALAMVLTYIGVTTFYSLAGKQMLLLDVITLAGLYTIRLEAGGLATNIPISSWTLGYSGFLFLSLALMKRCVELKMLNDPRDAALQRRSYWPGDVPVLSALGVAGALVGALVLALYLRSPEVLLLYSRPGGLWLLCVIHVYGVGRLWILTHRGEMHTDPVLFALKDRTTYWLAAVGAAVMLLSR